MAGSRDPGDSSPAASPARVTGFRCLCRIAGLLFTLPASVAFNMGHRYGRRRKGALSTAGVVCID